MLSIKAKNFSVGNRTTKSCILPCSKEDKAYILGEQPTYRQKEEENGKVQKSIDLSQNKSFQNQ